MDGQGYSGSESYRYVDPILESNAPELLVISPYIGMGYAKRLVNLGARKRIKVLTSPASERASDYLRNHSRYLIYGFIKADAILAVGVVASTYFSLFRIALFAIALAVGIGIVATTMHRLSKNSNIQVKISYDRFVHEKAYISGAVAAVGSANLTYKGMHKNVERVELITDPGRISQLRAHFFNLWESCK